MERKKKNFWKYFGVIYLDWPNRFVMLRKEGIFLKKRALTVEITQSIENDITVLKKISLIAASFHRPTLDLLTN